MRVDRIRVVAFFVAIVLVCTLVVEAAERGTRQREATPRRSNQGAALAESFVYQSGWSREVDARIDRTVDISQAGKPSKPDGMYGFEREILVDGIAHYTADVQVGDGPYDVIRVHRVVKELEPYRPIRTGKNIFLLHGSSVGFVKFIFGSASPSTPDDRSVAVYLAQNGIDVWGMDQDWALVPADTTDFGFMADWGLQHQVDNLDTAVGIARYTRLYTGNGFARMNVLGYSAGSTTLYALANQETQLPPGRRNVGGIIPVDFLYKPDPADEEAIEWLCGYVADLRSTLAAGVYEDPAGLLMKTLGALATEDPEGPSPFIPGLTNFQAALFFFAETFQLFPLNDWWHYMTGVFDQNGLPVDFAFTTLDEAFDFMATAASYEPVTFGVDQAGLLCGDVDLPFDDYFDQITVPVLYLGPVGGVGETGVYTTTLLGSSDISLLLPQFLSDDEHVLDIGHIDIWTAEVAEESVWRPMLDWIVNHSVGRP